MTKLIVCPNCAGDVKLGIAINPEYEYGLRDSPYTTILNHKTLEIIDVFKCENCGHSYVEEW